MLFKCPKPFMTLKKILTVTSCKIKKQITSFQHIIAQNTIHFLKERNGNRVREERTKASLKHRGKPSNLIALSQTHKASVSKDLDGPYPCNVSFISLFGYFNSLYAASWPWEMSHSIGTSSSCGLKMKHRLHPHSFTQ